MRWSTRIAGAAAAAALLVGAFVAPASAAPGATAPPVSLTQESDATRDNVYGLWGTYANGAPVGGFDVPEATTVVHVTIPTQLADHAGDSWSFSFRSLPSGTSFASGPVTDTDGLTLTVPIPGTLHGQAEVSFVLSNDGDGVVSTHIDLYASLHVRSGIPGDSVSLNLTKESSSDFAHSVSYDASVVGSPATPGSVVTLTSPTGTWTTGPDGDWVGTKEVRVSVGDFNRTYVQTTGFVSADGSTVTVQLPTVAKFRDWPYFPAGTTALPVHLNVSMMEKGVVGETVHGGSIDVGADITLVPAAIPSVGRISAPDRYSIAASVSQEAFPDGADTAFVVTGENYPDALSTAPAAVHLGGPLLLTTSASLPTVVADELKRLSPSTVYVVGGPNSVSDSVVTQIEKIGATVHRIGGADRYAASRALATAAFTGAHAGSGLVYVATGGNFPDALAAGGAAGHADAPVVLVNGGASGLDAATVELLFALNVIQIKIAGGPASVSPGIEADLGRIAPTMRLSGADRIAAAAAINLDAYGASEHAFLVTGYKFPDALAGSAWAGSLGEPLYVSLPECVPGAVSDALARQGVSELTPIGGTASLSPAIDSFTLCPGEEFPTPPR